jgi:carboxylate-amine ligase
VEWRIADVCTSIDDAVLHAGLVRSLTAVLARRAVSGRPPTAVRPEVLRAARWRAARYGVTEQLLDPVSGDLVDAAAMVERLLREIEGDLAERGELDEMRVLVQQVFGRGTSAMHQRTLLQRTSDERAVLAWLVDEGMGHCGHDHFSASSAASSDAVIPTPSRGV